MLICVHSDGFLHRVDSPALNTCAGLSHSVYVAWVLPTYTIIYFFPGLVLWGSSHLLWKTHSALSPTPKAALDWTCVVEHFGVHSFDVYLVIHGRATPHRTAPGPGPTGCLPLNAFGAKRDCPEAMVTGKTNVQWNNSLKADYPFYFITSSFHL